MTKKTSFRDSFLITASVLAMSLGGNVAFAMQEDKAEEDSRKNADVIEVTGTRIKNNYNAVSPISVYTAEDAELEGISDIANLLQSATAAASASQVTAAISSSFVTDGGPGLQSLSLRGLGANRTLVLLDGRRAGAAGTRGAVGPFDLNVIPQSIIQRAEVYKDGASSLYGSDAIAGVVNLITRNPEGFEFDMQANTPTRSGGNSYGATLTYGASNDNGSFSITFDYFKRNSLKTKDRDFLSCAEDYRFNPTTNVRTDFLNPQTGDYACRFFLNGWVYTANYAFLYTDDTANLPEGIDSGDPVYLQYDYDGSLAKNLEGWDNNPTNPFLLSAPDGFYPVAYNYYSSGLARNDHPFIQDNDVYPETNLYTIYSKGSYRVSDNVELYFDALYNKRKNQAYGARQMFWFTYGSAFGSRADPIATEYGLGGAFLFAPVIPVKTYAETEIDYHRVVLGARGDFTNSLLDGWSWDLFTQLSQSNGFYGSSTISQDVVDRYSFSNSKCGGEILKISGKECLDINFFSPEHLNGDFTDEERELLFGWDVGNTKYETAVFDGLMTGSMFELPAGEVGAAFGFQYRYEHINDVPGVETRTGNNWGRTTAGITNGQTRGGDVFMELDVPLLRDLPAINELNLSLSGRYTNMKDLGSATTYKAGLDWQLSSALRVRASKGTSFRTPNLYERFLNSQTSFASQIAIDPCVNWETNLENNNITQFLADNCKAAGIPGNHSGAGSSATVISGGNGVDLEPETSVSSIAGFIFRPDFADVSFAVDYFDIVIENEVSDLSAAAITSLCYNSEENGYPNRFCGYFDRYPADNADQPFNIETVRSNYINVARREIAGYDISLDYTHDAAFARFVMSSEATYMVKRKGLNFQGDEPYSLNGEGGFPELVGKVNLSMEKDDYTYSITGNYYGAWDELDDNDGDIIGSNRVVIGVDPVIYLSASIRKEFANNSTFIVGVRNLTDIDPPRVSTTTSVVSTIGTAPFYSQYDFFGRSVFLRFSKKF